MDIVLREGAGRLQLVLGRSQLEEGELRVLRAEYSGEEAGRVSVGKRGVLRVLERDLLRQDDTGDLPWPRQARHVLRQVLRTRLDALRQVLDHEGERGRIVDVTQLRRHQLRRHQGEQRGRSIPAFGVDELYGFTHGLVESAVGSGLGS